MQTAIRTSLMLLAALAVAPRADAQPTACQGRYAIDGSVDLGVGAGVVRSLTAGQRIALDGTADRFAVNIGDCSAAVVTRAPRNDIFVLRSRFIGCGERPRFRLRLAFAEDCRTLTGFRRSGGRLLQTFSAELVRLRNPGSPGGPIGTGPLDPNAPAPGQPGQPGAPTPPPNTTPIGNTPAISVIEPQIARPGDRVSLFGRNLDRDASGQPWNGTPPFLAVFLNRGFGTIRRLPAEVTFRSATELEVIVPGRALTGTIVLAVRNPDGSTGAQISETADTLVIARPDTTPPPAPVAGTPPTTSNDATVIVQGTQLNAIQPGTYALEGASFQAGAFLDSNRNFFVDLIDPTGALKSVPYLAFPVRTSDIDFSISPGTGYFAGADGMLWFLLGDVSPAAPGGEIFVTVHLDVDIASGTARPIAMVAGIVQQPGIVISTDISGFSSTGQEIQVESPVVGGPGAIRGHIAAVPTFLENVFLPSQPGICADPDFFCPDLGPSIQQNLWANGIDLTFDLPLFNDN